MDELNAIRGNTQNLTKPNIENKKTGRIGRHKGISIKTFAQIAQHKGISKKIFFLVVFVAIRERKILRYISIYFKFKRIGSKGILRY